MKGDILLSLVGLQENNDRKVRLVQSVLDEVRMEIIEGNMLNATFDLIVSNLKLSTLAVTTKNIKRVKSVSFTEKLKNELLEELESYLWTVLTEEKGWFTLTVSIENGKIVREKIQFKFTKKPLEG